MLQIEGLHKVYGKFHALNGLNLQIKQGELFGLVGPNGAGKTTSMKIIAGLLKADSGEVFIDGNNALKNYNKLKEMVGYMPDFFGVYDNLKVIEYLEFYASAYGIEGKKNKAVCLEMLDLVQLADKSDSYVDQLSRGMKQKLCLARALVHDPKLLILDEPASGMDPNSRFEFKQIIKQLREQGKTIIISSHILTELSEFCTSIGMVEKGKVVMQGNMEDILTSVDNSNPLIIKVYKNMEEAIHVLKKDSFVKKMSIEENTIMVNFTGCREEEAVLLKNLIGNGVMITSFSKERSNLESLFLKITNNEGVDW